MGKVREKLVEGTSSQHMELTASEISTQYGSHGLFSAAAILKPILSDIFSPHEDLATLALRSLAYFLHNENFNAKVSDEKASTILSSICQLIMSADKTLTEAKRSQLKPFIQAVNYNHIMPTKYTFDVDMKNGVVPEKLDAKAKRVK
ncbi:hypothetical protein L7F22_046322 [Adiantum nelumboides]|nr:hypothetical protein [Adiantum nelumboides]